MWAAIIMTLDMNGQRHWLAFALAMALILPAGVVSAAPLAVPPPLPENVVQAIGGGEPQLLGYGRMRWWFWNAFDASLWVAGDRWSWNEAFVLELRYIRDFDGSEIVEGTRNQWQHLGFSKHEQFQIWLTQLAGIFPNVKAGDQLAGVYLPGRETRFFHNGEPIGIMDDPRFGSAFFAIWLDERTSQPDLRKALLGSGACVEPTVVAASEEDPCGSDTMRAPSSRRPGAGRS